MLTYTQTLKRIEDTCGFNRGDIINNPIRKERFTDAINVAQDEVFGYIFNKVNHGWQFDDTYQEKYPIITMDIESGKRDYAFIADEQGNLILDIYKIMLTDSTGNTREIPQVDQQGRDADKGFYNSETGTPTKYDITANGIFFNLIPDFSRDDAIEIYINRTGMQFATSDTTKKAGFNPLYHEYLVLKPSYEYARDNGLDNVERLKRDMLEMRKEIETAYGNRGKDINRKLTPFMENNK
jgi:hypothetical protein